MYIYPKYTQLKPYTVKDNGNIEAVEKTKAFFIKYQNRLMFGTDMGYDDWYMSSDVKMNDTREIVRSVRRFFETDDNFIASDDPHSMWNRGESRMDFSPK